MRTNGVWWNPHSLETNASNRCAKNFGANHVPWMEVTYKIMGDISWSIVEAAIIIRLQTLVSKLWGCAINYHQLRWCALMKSSKQNETAVQWSSQLSTFNFTSWWQISNWENLSVSMKISSHWYDTLGKVMINGTHNFKTHYLAVIEEISCIYVHVYIHTCISICA